jgi:hypothetical protein
MAADSPVTAFAEALVGVVDKQVVSEGGYLKVDRGQVVIFGSKPAKDYGSGALRKIWEAKGAVDGGGDRSSYHVHVRGRQRSWKFYKRRTQ